MTRVPDAYTVGNKEVYDQALSEEPGLKKLGRQVIDGSLYDGGWVWRTRGEAEAFLDGIDYCYDARLGYQRFGGGLVSFEGRPPVMCAVYGLLLPNGWVGDVSTRPSQADGVHRLWTDSVLVRL